MGSKQPVFTDVGPGANLTFKWVKNAVTGIETDNAEVWVVALLILFFLQYFLIKKHFLGTSKALKSGLPPGPRNWPLVGALFCGSLEPNLTLCFTKLARKYGPICYYRLGSHSVVVVSSVEGAKEVLQTKDSQFSDRPNNTLLRTAAKFLGFESQDILFADFNDHLKTLKKACMTEFFTASKLAAYRNVRRHEAAAMVEEISSQVQNSGSLAAQGAAVEVRQSLVLTSTNIMCMLIFGKRFSDTISSETDEFRHLPDLVNQFSDLILKFNLVDIFPCLEWLDPQGLNGHYKTLQRLCTECYGQILEEHRAMRKSVRDYQDKDFVDFLLTFHENGKIPEDAIFGCLVDMIVGGIDSSAATTEWALLELVKSPESLARLQREIDEVVGRDRPVEESDFAAMPYLQAVIKETFRLHSPNPLLAPHFTNSSSSLGGFYVPANTTVFVNTYSISRDPLLWENPELFNPERFLGSRHSDVINLTGSSYQLLPFGRGRRMCPGFSLGIVLVQRALTTLVHAFDWSPPPGLAAEDISGKEGTGLSVRPEVPLVVSAVPRLALDAYRTT